jgi:Bax protein
MLMPAQRYWTRLSAEITAQSLSQTFRELGYDLKRVRAGEAKVPRLFLASLPGDLKDVRETAVRKSLFFKTVLPLVLQVNEEILRDRRRLWKIHYQKSLGERIGPADRLWLTVTAERYGIASDNIQGLLKRVDVIPPSMALAQAAEESGWGTSRFVQEGNAVFGQWTYSDSGSLVPARRGDDKSHKVKAFSSLHESVRAYATNLNTHRAYKRFRGVRASLRTEGAPLDGHLLAEHLTSYSERGPAYVITIKSLIEMNKLRHLDDARLGDEDTAPAPII